MRHAAILVSGSRNPAFCSQIAALTAAVRAIPWSHWQPAIYAFLGGPSSENDDADWNRWAPFLEDVVVTKVSPESFGLKDNWAQVDAALELAPKDADVLVLLDADTLPVGSLADTLDRVADEDLVAGVMAHYAPPAIASRSDWLRLAEGIIREPLSFCHTYSLVEPEVARNELTPFYVNGGVMMFGRTCFDRFAPRYLEIREHLAERVDDAFVGQIASTLTIAETGLRTWALPMRFNFPNDPVAERLHPDEAANIVIHHYLRTTRFDRHRIFATPDAFNQFLALALEGPDQRFQTAVRHLFDSRYPFALS
jgi:hypothetical protein